MTIWDTIGSFFSVFDITQYPLAFVDIIVVAFLFYGIYKLIKDTKAIRIALGIILVSAVFVVGRILNLVALTWLLKYFVTFIAVAIPVIFQPELRRAFERLGRPQAVKRLSRMNKREVARVLEVLIRSTDILIKNNIGGLIVLRRTTGLADHLEKGTILNAELSKPLLLNLLFPRSPLHDGAVIISGNQILAAGVVLPLTDKETAFQLGTRHKAALGITEDTDAVAIVISEERKEISIAVGGKLYKQKNIENLYNNLHKLLSS